MSTTQLFRVGLIVLLVLGMLIRPTLNRIGEIHGLEHRFQTSADSQINISVDKPSSDHFQGGHQLQHSAETGSSASLLPFLGILGLNLPQVKVVGQPLQLLPIPPLSFHFRPPIF